MITFYLKKFKPAWNPNALQCDIRLTNVRVTAKYDGIKVEFRESLHTVLDLLNHIGAKVQAWKGPYGSEKSVHVLLLDWHVSWGFF